MSASDSTDTPITAGPSISLDKQAGVPTGNTAGDTIDYTFLVANTGNVTLTSVGVSDPKVGTVSCPASTLLPGESMTCTATYTADPGRRGQRTGRQHRDGFGNPAVGTRHQWHRLDLHADRLAAVDERGQAGGRADGDCGRRHDRLHVPGHQHRQRQSQSRSAISDPKIGSVSCPVTLLAPGSRRPVPRRTR